jgi:hypothetical protein
MLTRAIVLALRWKICDIGLQAGAHQADGPVRAYSVFRTSRLPSIL